MAGRESSEVTERPPRADATTQMRDYSRLATTAFSRDHTAVTALVVGAGALGNEVVKNLALMGVERLWIADRDRVEASNLTRSILFCTPDIGIEIERGTPKAVLAARRVGEINPDVDVVPHVGEIADLGYGILRRADVIFSCLDNEMARLELSWACARLGRPLVDGGLGLMNYSSGMITVFPGGRRSLLRVPQGRRAPPRTAAGTAGARRPVLAQGRIESKPTKASRRRHSWRRWSAPSRSSSGCGRCSGLTRALGTRVPNHAVSDAQVGHHCLRAQPDVSAARGRVGRGARCANALRGRSDTWTPGDVLRECAAMRDGVSVFDWPITVAGPVPGVRATSGSRWSAARGFRRAHVARPAGARTWWKLEVLSGLRAGIPRGRRRPLAGSWPSARATCFEIVAGAAEGADRVHVETDRRPRRACCGRRDARREVRVCSPPRRSSWLGLCHSP